MYSAHALHPFLICLYLSVFFFSCLYSIRVSSFWAHGYVLSSLWIDSVHREEGLAVDGGILKITFVFMLAHAAVKREEVLFCFGNNSSTKC